MPISTSKIRKRIEVKGIVQGVGFRPFVYKLARELNLCGFVLNDSNGVIIEVEGKLDLINNFVVKLEKDNPPLSEIKKITQTDIPLQDSPSFEIQLSSEQTGNKTFISPDVSICDDCKEELLNSSDRRYFYPFINCTNCGPRYTIIENIPYDRKYTTMNEFEMCDDCKREYENPLDRRFHAQPNACPVCGPKIWLEVNDEKIIDHSAVLDKTVDLLLDGKIVAIKGLGGYHLAVDAKNDFGVKRLRERKNREAKPLAVMTDSIESVKKFAEVNKLEEKNLTSVEKPIVLLKKKSDLIPGEVAPGNKRIGVMLPYTPLHVVLFEKLKERGVELPVLVMTSANLSEEPIVINEEDARDRLKNIADAYLMHNRKILIRTDDSVVSVINNKLRTIRRSRGYVPKSFTVSESIPSILAVGAELKNTIALSKDDNVFVSQHVGDLTNLRAYKYFEESIIHLQKIMDKKAEYYASDLHPDYLSTKWVLQTNGLKKFSIQHHHAHMASCMLENNTNEKVIGVVLDGTGLGYDNTIWGGEILIGDYTEFERFAHLEQLPLPGGDAASKEPWRIAAGYLYSAFDGEMPEVDFLKNYPVQNVIQILDKKINSPMTSSTGRMFDAISALAGGPHKIKYEAEGAIQLTQAVTCLDEELYEYDTFNFEEGIIPLKKLIRSIYKDVSNKSSFSKVANRFHITLAQMLIEAISNAVNYSGINKIVLSGGTFQNDVLLTLLENKLTEQGLQVYSHSKIPTNDGGISFGQIAVASHLIKKNLHAPIYKTKGELKCA